MLHAPTNSHYFAFQSFKNNNAITHHSQKSDCSLYDMVRATVVIHCCFNLSDFCDVYLVPLNL